MAEYDGQEVLDKDNNTGGDVLITCLDRTQAYNNTARLTKANTKKRKKKPTERVENQQVKQSARNAKWIEKESVEIENSNTKFPTWQRIYRVLMVVTK